MSSQPSPLGKPLGVGVLGYGFMGIVHSSALLRLPQLFPDIGLSPQLVAMAGRDAEKLTQVAGRFGYTRLYRDWEQLVADPDVGLLDNSGPNYLHAEPCIAAARAGKHLLCEKPLARSATEAWRMLEAAQSAGVVHMCGFNYRFVPAIRLARQVIAEGSLGKIFHFRAHYLQPSLVDPSTPVRWRMSQEQSGYGVLGDLGSHIVDLARFLVGEPASVSGCMATFTAQRPARWGEAASQPIATDDSFQALVQFHDGATGTLEASKMCLGSNNRLELEVNGSEGTLRFNLERLNELQLYLKRDSGAGLDGFRTINSFGPDHPWFDRWFPNHPLGWEHSFVHEMAHLLGAIAGKTTVAPLGATFEDGYRAAVICDAIAASARTGSSVKVDYASPVSNGEGLANSG